MTGQILLRTHAIQHQWYTPTLPSQNLNFFRRVKVPPFDTNCHIGSHKLSPLEIKLPPFAASLPPLKSNCRPNSVILRNFVQFGGHASRTPCAAMNFGFGHGSRHPVPNVKCVTSGPNLPRRCKKGRNFENFRLECRIFGGVTPNFAGCRSAESVFWVTGHNPCRIERNCAVCTAPWLTCELAKLAHVISILHTLPQAARAHQ
jgi:hypothetical protein